MAVYGGDKFISIPHSLHTRWKVSIARRNHGCPSRGTSESDEQGSHSELDELRASWVHHPRTTSIPAQENEAGG